MASYPDFPDHPDDKTNPFDQSDRFLFADPVFVMVYFCSIFKFYDLYGKPIKQREAAPVQQGRLLFSLFVTSATNTSFKASVTCSISSSFSIFIRTSSLYVFCSRYIVILLYHSPLRTVNYFF